MKITPEQALATYRNADLLYTEEAVNQAYDSMAEAIESDISDLNPVLVCVMNGGVILFSEILQRLKLPLQTDFIHVTRYGGKLVGGHTSWLVEPHIDPMGRHVLIIDDILDEGTTLASIIDYYRDKKVASIRSAVLVVKDRSRELDYMADYVGLHVPDRYVFGCGMDYKGYLRNLPCIYAENA